MKGLNSTQVKVFSFFPSDYLFLIWDNLSSITVQECEPSPEESLASLLITLGAYWNAHVLEQEEENRVEEITQTTGIR